jgi:hypothetical protein
MTTSPHITVRAAFYHRWSRVDVHTLEHAAKQGIQRFKILTNRMFAIALSMRT